MVYPIWEDFIPSPEKSFKGKIELPLFKTNSSGLGAYRTRRVKTRAILEGSFRLKLEVDQLTTFRAFFKNSLFEGSGYFSAQWIADIGYDGYLGRMPSYSISAQGTLFLANCKLELIPNLRVDDSLIPIPFPDEYL